jgi:hypothetical protein
MKKSALLITFILMSGVVYLMQKPTLNKADREPAKGEWTVYEKNDVTGKVSARPLSDNEQERLPIVIDKPQEEKVASRAPAQEAKDTEVRFEGRRILGQIDPNQNYRTLNTPHSDWEEYFAQEMIRFQPSDVRVMVKHDDQLILSDAKTLRYVEEVTVTVVKSNGEISSFKAWADAETGLLLNTWSRSIVHNFRHRPLTFTPEDS